MSVSRFGQSRLATMVESIANVGSGMLIAFGIYQLAIWLEPFIQDNIWAGFELQINVSTNIVMTIVLTVVSVCRGYGWRRLFNHRHAKKIAKVFNETKGDNL